jgi:L-lactate dehydrogenase complex protein LldG
MKVSSAKKNILKKIRQALSQSTPIPFPGSEGNHSVFQPSAQDLEIEFAEQFTRLQGKFIFCIDHKELAAQLNALVTSRGWTQLFCSDEKLKAVLAANRCNPFTDVTLAECDAAVTGCELLVARTGSIVISAAGAGGRTASVYAPVHICIAYTDQLVYDIKDGLLALKEKYPKLPSLISFATGPSRTADIEKTLVVGVHGPKEVFLFLIDRTP